MVGLPKILIVENDEESLAKVRAFFSDINAEIVVARTEREFYSLIFSNEFALLMMDIDTSGVDVFRIMEQIKKADKHAPIILIAEEYNKNLIRIKGYDAGAIDYINKPINKNVFTAKVRVFLELFNQKRELEKGYLRLKEEIKKHKKTEEALLQAKRNADMANKSKSNFLATMSHEIRTPMNGVIGMLEVLSMTKLTDEQKQSVSVIRDSAFALLRIINDILDISKIEAGKLELEEITVPIRSLVESTARILDVEAKKKGIELKFNIADEVPDNITGDPVRIRQVISNLAGNAIKFTDVGSVTIDVCIDNKVLVIKIIDTGIGIDSETCSKVFQPFSQADISTTREYGGTGLGLSISKKLVGIMGGSITLDSVLGKGSIFTVQLPFEETGYYVEKKNEIGEDKNTVSFNENDAPENESDAADKNRLVIIADDDRINRIVLAGLLRKFGCYPIECKNGYEVIETYKPGYHSMIFTDCRMPVMNGYEVAKRIRQVDKDVPIIAVTANAMKEDSEKCLSAGMSDVIVKPVEIGDLKNMLARWLCRTGDEEFCAEDKISCEEVINFERLDKLFGGDEKLINETMDEFISSGKDICKKLCKSIEDSNEDEIIELSHKLGGSAAVVGAEKMSASCLELEKDVKNNGFSADCIEIFKKIEDNLNTIITLLK